jgi:hypothetical protein
MSPSAWRARATNLQLTRYDDKGWRATFYGGKFYGLMRGGA